MDDKRVFELAGAFESLATQRWALLYDHDGLFLETARVLRTISEAIAEYKEKVEEAHQALDAAGVARGAIGHSVRYRIGLLLENAKEQRGEAVSCEHVRQGDYIITRLFMCHACTEQIKQSYIDAARKSESEHG